MFRSVRKSRLLLCTSTTATGAGGMGIKSVAKPFLGVACLNVGLQRNPARRLSGTVWHCCSQLCHFSCLNDEGCDGLYAFYKKSRARGVYIEVFWILPQTLTTLIADTRSPTEIDCQPAKARPIHSARGCHVYVFDRRWPHPLPSMLSTIKANRFAMQSAGYIRQGQMPVPWWQVHRSKDSRRPTALRPSPDHPRPTNHQYAH